MALPLRNMLRSGLVEALLLRERWRSGIVYNPFTADMVRNPYAAYARLRARDPVHYSRLLNGWFLTRYADIDAVLRNPRQFSSDPRNGDLSRRQRDALPEADDFTMLFLDPPDHKRLRSLVNKAFTLRAVSTLEPRIRSLTGALLDDIGDPGGFDLMTALAHPLPVIVIAEMLGVPPEDYPRFRVWSAQRARALEPTMTREEKKAADAAGVAFHDFFMAIIRERRRKPGDDIISALVHVEEEGDRLSEREMLNMLRLLLVAGNETTTNLIGNGMLALLRNPDQLQRLRDDPSLIEGAIDELLRFDSPVQTGFRYALADGEVGGAPVRKGQILALSVGAANRDPDMFEDPDRLDIGRQGISHLSFGRGIHHCIGAPLARLEARIAFEGILERFGSIRLLAERADFQPAIVLRGLRSLPVGCART